MWAKKLYLFTLLYFWLAHIMIKHFLFFNFAWEHIWKDRTNLNVRGALKNCWRIVTGFTQRIASSLQKASFSFLYTLRILLAIPNAFGVYLVTLFFCCHTLCGICMESLDILKYALLLLCTKKCIPIPCFCTIIQFSF